MLEPSGVRSEMRKRPSSSSGAKVLPTLRKKKLLAQTGLPLAQMDVIELNEAFAAQGLAVTRDLGLADDDPRVNPNGGAIAIGHPLGMSGNRITLHLALELARRGGGTGAAALCGGGGQGDAILIRTLT